MQDEQILGLPRHGWIAAATGLVVALLVAAVPLLRHIMHTFAILAHEMGHAIVGLLFGYFSIPAFDFQYGGGVTIHGARTTGLVVIVYGLVAAAAWAWRRNTIMLVTLGVLTAVYSVVAFTSAHQVVILAAGHGVELLIAGIFLYRAFTGASVVNPAERPVYAIVGWSVVMLDVMLFFSLVGSAAARANYEMAKSGALRMDFTRIADDYWNTSVEVVAGLFLLLALVTPVAALVAAMNRDRLLQWLGVLFDRNDPAGG